ncbi:MAG: hypothetical protein CSB49_01785 [Proteobacteria bacterium]|nr:MAG: hypothetical protein CSB49_01785 [Pseudomonadota bacterium]
MLVNRTSPAQIVTALCLVLALSSGCDDDGLAKAPVPTIRWTLPERGAKEPGGLRRGLRVPPELGRRPRFSRRPKAPGLRCVPDGILGEWRAVKGLRWHEAKPITGAKNYSGAQDQSAKIALVSYGGGISLVITATDDVHLPAKAAGAFGYADAVELELWPLPPKGDPPPTVGLRLWLGSYKQLARFDRPKESWRDNAAQAFGGEIAGGWQIEARLSLGLLTPLPAPKVERLRFRMTVHDRDSKNDRARPTLRAEGTIRLDPTLDVPEAVQRRGSVRLCMADLPDRALWGFRRGWRCSIPYRRHRQPESDTEPTSGPRFSHARLPKPPMMRFLRERLLLLNYPELRRGVAGLIDMDKDLVSMLRLGIVGAQDPGNPRTRTSDAEPLRLPDGTWAVAVTHAYPLRDAEQRKGAEVPTFGMRCAGGHRVYLSIIALRGAPHVTPHQHVPKPDPPPQLAEALRVLLEDCERSRAYDWSISRDRKRVTLRDSIFPQRTPRIWRYDKASGTYRLDEGETQR